MTKRNIAICTAIVLVAAVALFFLNRGGTETENDPLFDSGVELPELEQLAITVAWNPHSTADDMTHALIAGFSTQVTVRNVPGANGANGKNAVFDATRNGEELLATSLSAFATAEAMGFGESSRQEWSGWLCAFAPAIVVVAVESPFQTMSDLAEEQRPLIGANSGFGTVSFIAAEILRTEVLTELEHVSHAGSSPAINSLRNGEADFAVMLSVEAVNALRSGELRAIAAFTEMDFAIPNADGEYEIIIPSLVNSFRVNSGDFLPLGEYFGLFIPSDTPQNRLNGIESTLQNSITLPTFTNFINERGMVAIIPNSSQNAMQINRLGNLILQTLYATGFIRHEHSF